MTKIPDRKMGNYLLVIQALLFLCMGGVRAAEFTGSGALTEETREAMESMDMMADLPYEKQDEAVELVFASLVSIDREIKSLEQQMENISGLDAQASQRVEEVLDRLLQQRERVSRRYRELRNSSGDDWQNVKSGFLTAIDSLFQDMSAVRERLAEKS